jgi:branched-chain amino acid transport system ATP-binding protein
MNALSVQDVAVSFGGVNALKNVTLEVAVGERRVLMGPNGAGKTTLFNVIGGQLRPHRGRMMFFGRDIASLRPFQRAHLGLARTFQITTLFANLTVEDNIYLAVQALDPKRYAMLHSAETVHDTISRGESLLDQWRFGPVRSTLVRDLSYGEQRKLELIMALAQRPRLLLLDEPTAGLSRAETEHVVELVQGLSRDVTVIVVEHDMDVAFRIGESFTIMNEGAIVTEGAADAIRTNSEIQSIYFGDAAR